MATLLIVLLAPLGVTLPAAGQGAARRTEVSSLMPKLRLETQIELARTLSKPVGAA